MRHHRHPRPQLPRLKAISVCMVGCPLHPVSSRAWAHRRRWAWARTTTVLCATMCLGKLSADVLHLILSHLLYHEPIIDIIHQTRTAWTCLLHFGSCGQSCGCCRSHNREDAAPGMNCQPCYTGWILRTVSHGIKGAAASYACRTFHRMPPHMCTCDTCMLAWIRRGWVCPMLWHSEVEAPPAESLD